MVIHTETGHEFNTLKVTICELKAGNRVNVTRFKILVNCPFSTKPYLLEHVSCFSDIPIRFDLSRSSDSQTPQKHFL